MVFLHNLKYICNVQNMECRPNMGILTVSRFLEMGCLSYDYHKIQTVNHQMFLI